MGKKTKLREAQRRHAADTIAAVLARSKAKAYPAIVATYGDFKPHYSEKIEALRHAATRAPEKWRCRIKSRRDEDRFIDLVKHSFTHYPLAAHFDSVWVNNVDDDFVDRVDPIDGDGPGTDLRHWYIIVGSGRSLYEHVTNRFLTRKETHHFLTAPPEVAETSQALWYAVARSAKADASNARTIAHSRLLRFSVASSFWRQVARFFAQNPVALDEMNDLIGYFHAAWRNDHDFSLKGRGLNVLRRRHQEWLRAEEIRLHGGNTPWEAQPLPDAVYTTGSGDTAVTWRFRQIMTGFGLYEEGRLMAHCVATYQSLCAYGTSAIFSLASGHPDGSRIKRVTIEVRNNRAVTQCRGYRNRLPQAEEAAIIKRWARDAGLEFPFP